MSRVLQSEDTAIGSSINGANSANSTNSVNTTMTDTHIITVFEHKRLTARDFVHVADFHWLMAQEYAVFSIKRQQGQWQLKVGHYIGIILLPSGMTLEILPKLMAKTSRKYNPQQPYDSAGSSAINQTRQWVQSMLADLTNSSHSQSKLPNTKNLGQFSNQLAALPLTALPLSDWLIAQFLQRLSHYQPTKHYQTQIHNQAALQGRLLIKEQLRHNSLQPHKFVCESSVLSQEMLSNRLIKSALVLLAPLFSVSPPSLQQWQQVAVLSRYELQRLKLLYQQAKRQLALQPLSRQQLQAAQQLLDLAYWLLQQSDAHTGNNIDPNPSVSLNPFQPRLCLLIDMNQAFEQWASQRIATMFHQTNLAYKPLFQTQSVWLNDAEGQACLSIRPDLLIYKAAADKGAYLGLGQLQNQDDIEVSESESADDYNSGHYSHVIDMKWKHLAHAGAISANDAYQLTSYAQAYRAEQVWLVYPVQDDIRQPVELRQQAYNESTDCRKTPYRQSNPARLWLIPFNVITRKINGGLLPDVNVV
ncbi:McrC family protein [Psychrobacter maritimus]|uniref:McrC family protein n=1 Tax=Psychrobacter maritimus TaxID=256325 RepID=UPI003FD6299B